MKPGKLLLLVLLGLNLLMELGGGAMFVTSPERAAGMFVVTSNPESAQLLGVVGAATLAFALLNLLSISWVLRNRREGFTLAAVQGAMLVVTGGLMVFTGTSMGTVDLAKGVVIGAVALWVRSEVPRRP